MRYFLSYLALLPAAILCYLPVIHHVRVRKTLLIRCISAVYAISRRSGISCSAFTDDCLIFCTIGTMKSSGDVVLIKPNLIHK